MTDKPRKKARVIREVVKDRHTSHWDLDYLSRAELEALMTQNKPAAPETVPSPTEPADDGESTGTTD